MALKTKQYLENSWYRGASQDRQTGYAAQFQYGENVNIRNMKNGVCLSGGVTKRTLSGNTGEIAYCAKGTFLIRVYLGSKTTTIQGRALPETDAQTLNTANDIGTDCFVFDNQVWICGKDIFTYQYNSTGGVSLSPSIAYNAVLDGTNNFKGTSCAVPYANTMVLVGSGNKLWRYIKVTSTVSDAINWKVIREFEETQEIVALTQEGNYLKIYTTDGVDTYIHYAKGTFDVEYTGLIQTVKHEGMVVESQGCVATDGTNDYGLFRTTDILNAHFVLKKISGYSGVDIRRSETVNGENIFYGNTGTIYPPFLNKVICDDGVLFANMGDGIRTFTEYNGWLWGGCIEFKREENTTIYDIFQYKDFLYASVNNNGTFEEWVYDLRWQPATYQSSGFIIGRVFDGGCGSLFKKNVQATITYNMPTDTEMELSYRYDRSSFSYDKVNFLSIKKLTDTSNCYDLVFPTTPSTKEQDLLALEDGDNILLENGNNILLEDLMICPFNQTWNYLEYRMDLSTNDTTKTPILFEHSLLYDDRVRKYR